MSDVYSLPYNQVAFKASHNSYDRDETLPEQLQWYPEQPWQGGCRGLELDISQSKSGNAWSVGHDDAYSSTAPQFSQYLVQLHTWATTNQNGVITLYLDLKTVQPDFYDGLDAYIRTYLDWTIFRPVDLMGSQPTVGAGARKTGWPSLGELQRCFIVVLSGDDSAKQAYSEADPRARLCFADKDQDADEAPQSDTRVFFNYHLYQKEKSDWCSVFQGQAGNPASVVRGYIINSGDFWNDALSCGCNVLTTDKVRNYSWATVSSTAPYAQLKPLG
jgi:hypothetical protein